MKKVNLFLFAIAAVFAAIMIFSCSQSEFEHEKDVEDLMTIPEGSSSEELSSNGTVRMALLSDEPLVLTKSEAIALAVERKGTYEISEREAIDMLERYTAKDGVEKSVNVQSVVLKKNAETGKNMYYEFALQSEKGVGFSIISADERVPEVLCYSEVGSISDTTFNKSMKFCFELMDLYVEAETKEELDIETLAFSAKEKQSQFVQMNTPPTTRGLIPPVFDLNNPMWIYDGCAYYDDIFQTLKQIPGNWHQDWPYNGLLPYVTTPNGISVRAYAGCSMIAVTQIMSYHKKPFGGYISTPDWLTMTATNPSGLSKLQSLIRDAFNAMQIFYDHDGTSSNITKARTFLNNNGYTAGAATTFSSGTVGYALQYGPTYIRGDDSSFGGHAWVVDGIKTYTYYRYDYYHCLYSGQIFEHMVKTITGTNFEVRYDWGWGEGNTVNTWYNGNIFVPVNHQGENYNISIQLISSVQ